MRKFIISTLLGLFSTTVLADSVITTETRSWRGVPITVDQRSGVYSYEGTLPEGDVYFTYSGHRCLKVKKDIAGVNAIVLQARVPGGSEIYCYPE